MNVLLVPAHPGFPGQIPQSRKTVVCVCVFTLYTSVFCSMIRISKYSACHGLSTGGKICTVEMERKYMSQMYGGVKTAIYHCIVC